MKISKLKRNIFSCIAVLLLLSVLIFISSNPFKNKNIKDIKPSLSSDLTVVKPQNTDKKIIPDKYNTGAIGASSDFITVDSAGKYNNISFSARNDNKLALDFYYSNKNITGDVIFENYDFSKISIMMINENISTDRNLHLIFKNCKLGSFSSSKTDSAISYTFTNCNIQAFNGSNTTFNNCHFGGTVSDALNVYRNVSVNNCYISNLSVPASDGTFAHSDGVQIYGYKNSITTNINFNNCRFEIPQLACATSSCYVNACLMVQLEYSDADGIHFNDCYINGGGYSIYAWDKNLGNTLNDVTFKNIKVGCVRRYGQVYPKISSGVKIDYDTLKDTDNLYASTVSRDKTKKETYITISNDTNEPKNFRIYTSSGKVYDYSIEKCPTANEVGNMSFDDFPFDRQYSVPEYCDWIVCYEVSSDENGNESLTQIRYMNWSDDTVALDLNNTTIDTPDSFVFMKPQDISSITSPIILEGSCGKNISFELHQTGELILTGSGATYNYNSKKPAPWYDYSSDISTIIIDDGITKIGTACFKNLQNVANIYFPDGISAIGSNSFINCTELNMISLPSTINSIGSYAFWGTAINKVSYDGTNNQKKDITISKNNPAILTEELNYSEPKITQNGECGKNISWTFYSDGTLILDGKGATYNYNSNNPVPWAAVKSKITTIKVGNGITTLGSQVFSGCGAVTSVELPDSLTTLGSNSFMCSSQLKNITLPNSITAIGNYAFHDSGLKTVTYTGTSDEWSNIEIGAKNDPLINSTINFSK